MNLLEGLEDWVAKKGADKLLAPMIAKGEMKASDLPTVEKAAVILLNAFLTDFAQKQGITS